MRDANLYDERRIYGALHIWPYEGFVKTPRESKEGAEGKKSKKEFFAFFALCAFFAFPLAPHAVFLGLWFFSATMITLNFAAFYPFRVFDFDGGQAKLT
jgi:hypothetical protein